MRLCPYAALATENPTPDLLLEKPHGRKEPLISTSMWKHVIVQGCYQLFWLFLIIYAAPATIHSYKYAVLPPWPPALPVQLFVRLH